MSKKQLFIRGDLNSLQDGFIPLRNPVWIYILKKEYGENIDGKSIWLYEKTLRDGKENLTIFPGLVSKVNNDKEEYTISVNEKDFEYLTDSKTFPGYQFEDVVGNAWSEALDEKFPEYRT